MDDDLDRRIAALQRDTKDRQVLTVAVVAGIFAGIAGGFAIPYLTGVNFGTMRSGGLLVCFLAPFAICMGIGYLIYAILRRIRG